MSKHILVSIVVAVAAFASLSIATPVASQGWNKLLNADSALFSDEVNLRKSKSNDAAVVLDEFKSVLEQNKDAVYARYEMEHSDRPSTRFLLSGDSRLELFVESLVYVAKHNIKAQNGGSSFELGVNQFSDITQEEFVQFSGYKPIRNAHLLPLANYTVGAAFTSLDYRDKKIFTPVKNQSVGKIICGACQAFTSTSQLESVKALKTNEAPVELSPQELVDCAAPSEDVCGNGLDVGQSTNYLIANGVGAHSAYEYTAKQGPCKNTTPRLAFVKEFGMVDKNEEALKEALFKYGPISVSFAVTREFQLWKKGIYEGSCETEVNHGLVLAGYGNEGGKDFWIVKNSWKLTWGGEQGFGKIIRNVGGTGLCLIADQAVWVTV